jgi:hypothetical protein
MELPPQRYPPQAKSFGPAEAAERSFSTRSLSQTSIVTDEAKSPRISGAGVRDTASQQAGLSAVPSLMLSVNGSSLESLEGGHPAFPPRVLSSRLDYYEVSYSCLSRCDKMVSHQISTLCRPCRSLGRLPPRAVTPEAALALCLLHRLSQ